MDTTQLIISILGLLGISGIVASYLNKRKELEFKILENREKRYKSCLLFMDAYIKPENIKYLSSRHPDINSSSDVIEYLKAEYHEMILYASIGVVLSVKEFIENPDKERFLKVVLEMRKDLWIKEKNVSIDQIELSK